MDWAQNRKLINIKNKFRHLAQINMTPFGRTFVVLFPLKPLNSWAKISAYSLAVAAIFSANRRCVTGDTPPYNSEARAWGKKVKAASSRTSLIGFVNRELPLRRNRSRSLIRPKVFRRSSRRYTILRYYARERLCYSFDDFFLCICLFLDAYSFNFVDEALYGEYCCCS